MAPSSLANGINGIHNGLERIKNGFPDGHPGSHTDSNIGHDPVSNGYSTNGSESSDDEEPYDLICVGFGPASLAIAIALREQETPIRALFLERQPQFAWHSGMLLPETHMQISFMKDLATLRNPRSEFTFINYLHTQKRLVAFTNLSTFLPLREEYNDYMSWCAAHFDDQVRYSHEVASVSPSSSSRDDGPIASWRVISRNTESNTTCIHTARNIVIAIGGQPALPPSISPHFDNPRIIHSSQYASAVPALLSDHNAPYNIAVVGAGQSSAEIFNDLHSRYPNAQTSLFIRAHALKPSDDSPFVNEIFDPERVDTFFSLQDDIRNNALAEDKATNYSVVRLNLLETLYAKMYQQRLRHGGDEEKWEHRIFPLREVDGVEFVGKEKKVSLRLRDTRTGAGVPAPRKEFDAVIFGTGYRRNVHETLLKPAMGFMKDGVCKVGRDYGVIFEEGKVEKGVGIYLQGCCEKTHGLSDTLLSILAVRSGELVDSIFGGGDGSEKQPELSSDLHSKLTSKTNGVHHMNGTSNGAVNGDARA